MSLHESLCSWLRVCFHAKSALRPASPSDPEAFADGVRVADVLVAIDDRFFSQEWRSKIKVRIRCLSFLAAFHVKVVYKK
jgi:hypothetical protein